MLPSWLSVALGFLAKLVTNYLADRRAEAALRDLGAASARAADVAQATAQEAAARAAGEAVKPNTDDDGFRRD